MADVLMVRCAARLESPGLGSREWGAGPGRTTSVDTQAQKQALRAMREEVTSQRGDITNLVGAVLNEVRCR